MLPMIMIILVVMSKLSDACWKGSLMSTCRASLNSASVTARCFCRASLLACSCSCCCACFAPSVSLASTSRLTWFSYHATLHSKLFCTAQGCFEVCASLVSWSLLHPCLEFSFALASIPSMPHCKPDSSFTLQKSNFLIQLGKESLGATLSVADNLLLSAPVSQRAVWGQ